MRMKINAPKSHAVIKIKLILVILYVSLIVGRYYILRMQKAISVLNLNLRYDKILKLNVYYGNLAKLKSYIYPY